MTRQLRKMAVRTQFALLAACLALGLVGYFLYIKATANFHEVVPGEVYRSGQLEGSQLRSKVEQFGIVSVLNLRGPNLGKAWYDEEMQFCERRGIAHYDISLSAGREVPPGKAAEIVRILRSARKPLLIHCKDGADRAAFGAALYRLAVQGQTRERADDELTIWYGHVPMITPHVAAMDRSFSAYAEYLSKHPL
jgi:protein tyrosine/serine phosphatase